MSDIFNNIRLMMDGQAKLIKDQGILLEDNLGLSYKYLREEITSIKEVREGLL